MILFLCGFLSVVCMTATLLGDNSILVMILSIISGAGLIVCGLIATFVARAFGSTSERDVVALLIIFALGASTIYVAIESAPVMIVARK